MSNFNQYSWFKTKRTELATLLQESATVIKDLSMPQFSGNLKKLSQKVHSDTFKIQLVGTFKNGKSTFLAADGNTDLFIGEGGSEICCASNDDKQCKYIWREIAGMRGRLDPKKAITSPP